VKVEITDENMTIKVRQPDWEQATRNLAEFRSSPPEGYKLVSGKVNRRKKTGRANNLSLVFEYCDDRVDPFSVAEAYAFFKFLEPFKGPRDEDDESRGQSRP